MEAIITLIVGAILIFLGIRNMQGDISSLHSYHRERVKEEDILPFGRRVGLGTIIVGCGVAIFGVFSLIASLITNDTLVIVGTVIMAVAIVVGLVIAVMAMIKYNKGVF